jgi:hypothetical protein
MPRKTLFARFWEKVEYDPNTQCWNWTAAKTKSGYADFSVQGRSVRAARWLYGQMVAPVPADLTVDHLCSNRACVNPGHLEVVTRGENTMRAKTGITVLLAQRTHCVNGHEFTPENTYPRSDRGRGCCECRRLKNQAWRERSRARKAEAAR